MDWKIGFRESFKLTRKLAYGSTIANIQRKGFPNGGDIKENMGGCFFVFFHSIYTALAGPEAVIGWVLVKNENKGWNCLI